MISNIWAVVPAAGSGQRMSTKIPKQYLTLSGVSILELTVRSLLACPDIRGMVVLLDADDEYARSVVSLEDPRVTTGIGGSERADSVLAGLDILTRKADFEDWVLVHDAARPCLTAMELSLLISTARKSGMGCVLAERSVDTLKRVDSRLQVLETVDRSALWRVQTPQLFPLGQLYEGLKDALDGGLSVTDESMAMELAGHPVKVIEGFSTNIKVTLPADLDLAEAILSRQLENKL